MTASGPRVEIRARWLIVPLVAGCTQERIGVLLETSRRSVGRLIATDVTTGVQESTVLAHARTCLTASATRGSTVQERDAAEAWLVRAERDQRPAAPASAETPGRHARAHPPDPRGVAARLSGRRQRSGPEWRPPPTTVPPHTRLAVAQVEELTREQQRLARRSLILGCAVTTLDPAPLREALDDLVTEIAESARAIGTLLEPAGRVR